MTSTSKPLDGIKVLDFTAIVLGPLATLMLADMGADVIKVEPPEGDPIRNAAASRHRGMGSIHLALNRNKSSLAVDLKTPDGREILQRLVRWADVVVHNMREGAAQQLGIDYASLKAVNPGIVHCVASGFGEKSPRTGDPAVDDIVQAGSGLASLLLEHTGHAHFVPSLLADKVSGLFLCNAVMAALLNRAKTGAGQSTTVPMYETMATFTLLEHLGGTAFPADPGSPGYGRLTTAHRRPMHTADGIMAMTPYSKKHWQAFFHASGFPEHADDPRVTDPKKRNDCIAELYELLSTILPTRPTADWMRIARELGIPASPVNSLQDLVSAPDLYDQGFLARTSHPSEGEVLAISPVGPLLGGTLGETGPAPRIGEHSVAILQDLGFAPEAIDAWRVSGVITAPDA